MARRTICGSNLISPLAARGDELILHLREGDAFKSDEERPLQKDHVDRFDLFSDRARRRDLLAAGKDDQTPAARARLESGAALAVMDRRAAADHDAARQVQPLSVRRGVGRGYGPTRTARPGDQPGREVYSRYLKTLIQERDLDAATPNTLYKRRVGQRLELLLETDPGRMKPDGTLVVKVLFDDKPLSGARVFAYHRVGGEPPSDAVTAVTSARGMAEFKVDQPGLWLVRMVHMQPVPSTRNPPGQTTWESFWAAYAFAVREVVLPVTTPTAKEADLDPDVHN